MSKDGEPSIAPEFAGGGLAAALGKGAARTPAPAAAASDEWVVFGVDTVAQMAAENAARAAGQSLGQWLSAAIAAAADEKK